MILWTIQNEEVWNILKENNVYYCFDNFMTKEYKESYFWMIQQMKKTLPLPSQNSAPISGWYQWENGWKNRYY